MCLILPLWISLNRDTASRNFANGIAVGHGRQVIEQVTSADSLINRTEPSAKTQFGAAAVHAAHAAPAPEPAINGGNRSSGRVVIPAVDALAGVDADLHPAAIAPGVAGAVVNFVGGFRQGDGVAGAILSMERRVLLFSPNMR